jgi:PAS domain S-box-containing protein
MNNFLLNTLYMLSGVCACAALHHGFIAWRRPVDRMHLLFAATCLAIALYVIVKALGYQAGTAEAVVEMRRWEVTTATLLFPALAWFVADYTRVRPKRFLTGLSLFFALIFTVNLALPYGVNFTQLPEFRSITLPWGEQVADLRPHNGAWFNAGWAGMLTTLAFCIVACVQQYRRGARRRATTLALALGIFLVFLLTNQAVNHGLLKFTRTAEFGFIALVIVMSLGLSRELRDSGRRMKDVLDNVPAIVFMKDPGGRYLLVNRAFEQGLQISSDAVAGKTDYEIFPAALADALRVNDQRVLESGTILEVEEVIEHEGRARSYRSLKFPLLDPFGEPYAVCGVSTDVTETLKAREEMRQLRGQLWHADRVARTGALSSSLAHELNQPLAAVLSNAQAALRMLAGTNPDIREIREILDDIVRDDKRASAVISSLLAMARRQESARSRIDLAEALQEVLNLLNSELAQQQVEVTVDLKPRCMVVADKVQIQQLVLNLAMNAIEAMKNMGKEHRHLQFSVGTTGDLARISVCDSGPGITGQDREALFEPFYTTKTNGTGMGLSVCRAIVEAHGGMIWLEPNALTGVNAIITLPLANAEPEKSAEFSPGQS